MKYNVPVDCWPCNEWIPTHGRRPDLPKGALIEILPQPGYIVPTRPRPIEYFNSPSWWSSLLTRAYRLAGPVNAAPRDSAVSASLSSRSADTEPSVAAPSRGHRILALTMAGWRPQGKLFGHRSE